MNTPGLVATIAVMSGLLGCQSMDRKPIDPGLAAQIDTLNRIERQNAEILTRLQAHENAIKALDPQLSALSRKQAAAMQCMFLSTRAHIMCMSQHSTETDQAIYNQQMKLCLRNEPSYRSVLASCQPEDAKLP